MILTDMGAEVIKLECPGKGDSVRACGIGSEQNLYFRYINRDKKASPAQARGASNERCDDIVGLAQWRRGRL